MRKLRARQWGLTFGDLPTGVLNAIVDVRGVKVGHTTLIRGDGPLQPGVGPVRTGVTVILPHGDNVYRSKVRAAVHTINGYGKALGFEQVRELGVIESPIALTNTLNIGLVADALVEYAIRRNPDIGITTSSVNVVVGETSDAYLNDLQGRHVRSEHVFAAIEAATGDRVDEGNIGAGTGTTCFGWKGGIGTASRVLPIELGGFTLGAVVQSNFGRPADLVIAGRPIGRWLTPAEMPLNAADHGSIMIVLATDAPLSSRQLHRVCVRAAAGVARTGSVYGHGSGDFVIAFSTANRVAHDPTALVTTEVSLMDEARVMEGLFHAVAESVEEAIVNSLCAAETMIGRDGHVRYALPMDTALARSERGEYR